MANGFTNLPTSLLGAVSIGGNLVVNGTTRSVGALSTDASLAVGVTPNITRVGNFTGYGPGVSGNLGFDAATRDNAGVSAALTALGANANNPKLRRLNAAGTAIDQAIEAFLGTDFTVRSNTGSATENTLVTKTIPAGLLGAHGGFILELLWNKTIQSSGTDTLRVKLGATTIFSLPSGVVEQKYFRVYIYNAGLTNSQKCWGWRFNQSTGTITNVSGTAAEDTTADRNLVITMQNTDVANVSNVELVSVLAANGFGPV